MNKDNAKQFLPMVQALADGKTIQVANYDFTRWLDMTEDIDFDMSPKHYRIKPEPREFWVSLEKDGRVYDCKPLNETIGKMGLGTIIKVREILD